MADNISENLQKPSLIEFDEGRLIGKKRFLYVSLAETSTIDDQLPKQNITVNLMYDLHSNDTTSPDEKCCECRDEISIQNMRHIAAEALLDLEKPSKRSINLHIMTSTPNDFSLNEYPTFNISPHILHESPSTNNVKESYPVNHQTFGNRNKNRVTSTTFVENSYFMQDLENHEDNLYSDDDSVCSVTSSSSRTISSSGNGYCYGNNNGGTARNNFFHEVFPPNGKDGVGLVSYLKLARERRSKLRFIK